MVKATQKAIKEICCHLITSKGSFFSYRIKYTPQAFISSASFSLSNKNHGFYYPVCWMIPVKDHLLLIGKAAIEVVAVHLFLSLTISLMPHSHNNMCRVHC